MKYSVTVNICMFNVTECVSGFTNGQMVHHNEFWDGIFSSLFINDGSVYPMLTEAIKEALKCFLFALNIWRTEQLLPPCRYSRVTSLSQESSEAK